MRIDNYYKLLCITFGNYIAIIPPLPEKQSIGRFLPEFIEERRQSLQLFLNRIKENTELRDSKQFLTFLQADEAAFKEINGYAAIFGLLQNTVQTTMTTISTSTKVTIYPLHY